MYYLFSIILSSQLGHKKIVLITIIILGFTACRFAANQGQKLGEEFYNEDTREYRIPLINQLELKTRYPNGSYEHWYFKLPPYEQNDIQICGYYIDGCIEVTKIAKFDSLVVLFSPAIRILNKDSSCINARAIFVVDTQKKKIRVFYEEVTTNICCYDEEYIDPMYSLYLTKNDSIFIKNGTHIKYFKEKKLGEIRFTKIKDIWKIIWETKKLPQKWNQ